MIETRTLEEQPTAAMFATLTVEEIGRWLPRAYGVVAAYLTKYGVGPCGMPYARYRLVGEGTFDVEAGFPATTPVPGEGEVEPSSLPAGEVAVTVHHGPYEEIVPAYDALAAWAADNGATLAGEAWEVYYSDPVAVHDPAEWRTDVVQPITRS